LIRKTANNNREYFLCFVDFENSIQASIAMTTLQGYRFDKHDKVGLKISYANESKDTTRDKKRRDRDR
jgi:outer membrane receptor for ferrienterochelin and colicin